MNTVDAITPGISDNLTDTDICRLYLYMLRGAAIGSTRLSSGSAGNAARHDGQRASMANRYA